MSQDDWSVIASFTDKEHLWTVLGVCRNSRDAVFNKVSYDHSLNERQTKAWTNVVLLGRSTFLTGGAGVGKSHVLRMCADVDVLPVTNENNCAHALEL